MSLTFDTQKAVQKLRDSGVQEPHANAMVEVVTDATSGLLTQEYFDARLQAEIQGVRGEVAGVQAEIQGVRGEVAGVRGEIQGVRGEIPGVRGEIQGVRAEFSHALLVLGLGLAGLMVAVAGASLAAAALLFD